MDSPSPPGSPIWLYGSVEPMPIRAPELDAMESEHQVIRALAIQAASVLYTERFDQEVARSAFAPVYAPRPAIKQSKRPSKAVEPPRTPPPTKAPLYSPNNLNDYLLSPPVWIGHSVARPRSPRPPPG